ncbi:MAG TPA: archease [Acidimicrobiales bacterium]
MGGERGHRAVAHTADVILEAWAPDLPGCLEEAVAALAEVYARPAASAEGAEDAEPAEGPAPVGRPVRIPPGLPETQLVDLLDEVLFALDTEVDVPVAAEVRVTDGGALDAVLRLAPRDRVEPAGAVPKAISRSELAVRQTPEGVSCRFLVDV